MPCLILSSSVDGELIRYAARCLADPAEVEVFTTVSENEYREKASGKRCARLMLRLRMYFWHPFRLFLKLLCAPSGTVFFVTTNPFFLPGCAALVGRAKGQRVVQILYDLFPDALEEAGLIPRNGSRARILGRFTRCALRRCEATVFLGARLRAHAEARWGPARRGFVIPVVVSSTIGPEPNSSATKTITIHYGGQLGWMHDAERLARAVRIFQESASDVTESQERWSFRISGAKARSLTDAVKGLDVEVGPTLPVDEWRRQALETEVGLVTLSEGGARVCLPSKTYGMMACGMAILALCPADSDLGRLIESSGAGWVVDTSSGDEERISESFCRTVHNIIDDPQALLQRRRNAWQHIRCENRLDAEGRRWRILEEEK